MWRDKAKSKWMMEGDANNHLTLQRQPEDHHKDYC